MKEQLHLVLALCALVTLLARGAQCHPLQETVAPVQEENSRDGPDLFSSVQDTDILVSWTRCNVHCQMGDIYDLQVRRKRTLPIANLLNILFFPIPILPTNFIGVQVGGLPSSS